MDLLLRCLILLACTPVLIFILHVAAARVFMRYKFDLPNQVVVIICSVAGYIPMAAAIWMVYLSHITEPVELGWAVIYSLIVYNALAYSYFHVFNMSETARRIRILYEIYISKQLKVSDMAPLYNANDMLNSRLERLLLTRQIKLSHDNYLLDHRLLYYAARIVAWWGCVLGFPPPQAVYNRTKQ